MELVNPRWRYKLRRPLNFLFVLGIFVVVVYFFQDFWVDAAAFVVLLYLNFYILWDRVIRIRCKGCGKTIRTNTPWVCGFKKCENVNADEFPFVHLFQIARVAMIAAERCVTLAIGAEDDVSNRAAVGIWHVLVE